jgi:predicted nucleotidyltransferase component of viral defense system
MIHPKEINKLASLHKVGDRQIEKDYVLTWALYGISQHPVLSKALVFKGGTVLKKCYLEGYRFSEDLDFTLLDEALTHEQLKAYFDEVYRWVQQESNVLMQNREDGIHKDSGSSMFYVDFIASLGGNLGSRDIKIDITRGEKLEFDTVERSVFIDYSDLPEESFRLHCYHLSEVLIEKMVALMGRLEARDLYDFWYLTETERLVVSDHAIEFKNKAEHKGQDPNRFQEIVLGKENKFQRDWEKKLKHQIKNLPNFDEVMRQMKRNLK